MCSTIIPVISIVPSCDNLETNYNAEILHVDSAIITMHATMQAWQSASP